MMHSKKALRGAVIVLAVSAALGSAACQPVTQAGPPAVPSVSSAKAAVPSEVAPSAVAPSAPSAARGWKDLFQAAVARKQAGDCAGAIPLFEQSLAIEPRPSTEFNLADCQESMGRIKTAWSLFSAAAKAAGQQGNTGMAANAGERAAALLPRLPKLDLAMPARVKITPSLEIRIDGEVVSPADWERPLPVDPGVHTVTAAAPGKQPFSTQTTAAEGTLIAVNVAPLADAPPAVTTPVRTAVVLPPRDAAGANPARPETSSLPGRRVAALVAGGTGVAALGVGIVFGMLAIDRNAAWKAQTAKHCDASGICDNVASVVAIRGIESDRSKLGDVSTVGFAVSGVALAGAVVLWVTAPPRDTRSSHSNGARTSSPGVSLRFSPAPLDQGMAGTLTGTF